MASFKYMGEPERPDLVAIPGKCTLIRVPTLTGVAEFGPVSGQTEIRPEVDTIEVTDARAVRYLRADTRFQEV